MGAELAARLLVPLHPQGWFVAGPNEDRYFVPAPGLSYTYWGSVFTHGPLGTPQGPAAPAGTGRRRVAFLGDSVCYGYFGSGPDNLTKQVEAALGPERWESLNFGVPGYNAHMVSATLREQALQFHPAAVVYVFHQNDLTNATWGGAFRARPSLFRERYDLPQPWWRRTIQRSYALSWLLERVPRPSPTPLPTPDSSPTDKKPAFSPYAAVLRGLLLEDGPHRTYFVEHLQAMRAACAAAGVPFALLFVPREETVALDPEGTYRAALQALCAEQGVTFLDGQAPFARAGGDLFGDAAHPNAAGHALLAEATIPWLRAGVQ